MTETTTTTECLNCGEPLTGETGYTSADKFHRLCARKVLGWWYREEDEQP